VALWPIHDGDLSGEERFIEQFLELRARN